MLEKDSLEVSGLSVLPSSLVSKNSRLSVLPNSELFVNPRFGISYPF